MADALAPAGVAFLAPAATWSGHAAPVTRPAWAPDGRTLATTARDGPARLWRPDGAPVRQLGGHPGGTHGLAFDPANMLLYD